jgi:non-ribosomal peptide synthetase component F
VNGLSDAVGCFGNTVPCAVSLRPGASVASSLHIVDEHVKAGLLHQFVSIPEILHALGLKGGAQLFNTCLSYSEELPDLNSRFTTRADLELKPVSQQHATSFDLSLHVRHLSGNLVLDASSSIIPEEQVINVANAFGVAVQSILSSPDSLVGDISLVSDRDHARIIAWSNEQISDELLRDVTVVHELVTRQALQTPDSPAVCAWDGDLSYQQMLDAATKLAHYLVDIGVGPHAAVPVVLDKSRWTPVALLAVLK